ncbi:hypothetical protein MED01_002352 [Micromonospora sp. MED01]|uniref:hypothetical protein n=1 Tax=Micromonospora alfalfae TaxID=2911212 RepID=UPI001EE90E6C|nr:hypothetical protein [Micromonospora alfalfae]MCG5464187.1 hypothetical protein [Micromonospora alfalfae]
MSTLALARRLKEGGTLPQRCSRHTYYVAGCTECKERARVRARARYQAASFGWLPPARVPVDEARAHIVNLQQQHNMSLSLIAEKAGVSFSTISDIGDGTTRSSQPSTVAGILAVRPAPPPLAHGLSLSVGSARRLQALAWAHYSSMDLAPMLPALPEVVRRWRAGTAPTISTDWHDRITALTARLHGSRGKSGRAHAHALREGWHPLAAWDDIDNPDATPQTPADRGDWVDEIAIELALNGERIHLTVLEKRTAVHQGLAAGMPIHVIGKALRMSGSTVTYHASKPAPAALTAA